MKPFVFRLERVQRLRYLAKREAEATLALALAAVRDLRIDIEDLQRRAEHASRELHETIQTGEAVEGDWIGQAADRITALHQKEHSQRDALTIAQEEVASCERKCVDALSAYNVLEKLRDKKRRAWIVDFEREQQKSLDELHRSRAHENREETRLS